jgi:predicted restriction endonuclease
MWKCKHCNNKFDYNTRNQQGNHTRWCEQNPKVVSYKKSNKDNIIKRHNAKFGELQSFTVTCLSCKETFEVVERSLLFPQQEKYFCSQICANTANSKIKSDIYWTDDKVGYVTVCFRYHEHKCCICGHEKIVDAHHLDENHENNSPKNFAPLCPTHHRMWHSRFKVEIEAQVWDYVNTRWESAGV